MIITVSSYGSMLTLDPWDASKGKLQDVFRGTPMGWDPIVKRYMLRPIDFPGMVDAAVSAGVELRPTVGLDGFLRAHAERLRSTQRFVDALPAELYPYQRDGAAFLHNNPTAFLFDDMGLGKTVQSLTALPANAAAIVVCPASLRRNWSAEVARWRPDLQPIIIGPGNSFQWPQAGEVVIVNYHGTPNDPDKYGKPRPGTICIADEAHAVKAYGSSSRPVQRTRRFRLLARRILKADGLMWLLTGTPVLNSPKELWGMLQALSLGRTVYLTYNRFVQLCGGVQDGLGQIHWNANGIHSDAMEPLKGYVLRRKRSDVLRDLPPKSRHQQLVDPAMSVQLLELLDETDDMYRELLENAANSFSESFHFGDVSALAYARKELAIAKIPSMLEALEEYRQADEPVVVFSAHRAPIEALDGRPGFAVIHGGVPDKRRQAAVDAFQAGELQGLACTIKTAGMGYTMTRAAHALVIDWDWTPAMNLQAEDRLVRIGQTRPVTIKALVADHPLDRRVAAVLERKMAIIDKTTERLNTPGTDSAAAPIDRNGIAEQLDRIADLVAASAR